jgi:RecJ-like exonuclease
MISMQEYDQQDEPPYVAIDPATFRDHKEATDYGRRNTNVERALTLCERCGGTGNEWLSMYRACEGCDGTGNTAKQK